MNVLQIIFSYDYLWINVRVKGGAYGCMCNFNRCGNAFFTSYRDPNLSKTYDVYKNAADYVEHFTASDRDMVKYIIGAICKMDTPLTPSADGAYSFGCYLSGVTNEELQKDRDEVLNTDVATIRGLADHIRAISSSGIICALGNEDKIEEQKELFTEVKSLF